MSESTTAASPTRAALMAALEHVVEPCSLAMGKPMSICDMGLIEDVSFDQGVVRVVLCLTDPACVNYAKISQFIHDVLLRLPLVESVQVSQTTTVLWTSERVRETPPQPIRLVRRPP